MRKWKWLKAVIMCGVIFAIALIGISLVSDECLLDSCPFTSSISLGIPTKGLEASEVGADYTKLASLLAKHRFIRPDRETSEKILKVAKREDSGKMELKDIQKLPCKDLRTINNLWLARSDRIMQEFFSRTTSCKL